MLKIIKINQIENMKDYIEKEYDHLPLQSCLQSNQGNGCLTISCLYKDILSSDDGWKYLVLSACSLVGLLDRNRIKACIQWPHKIVVNEKEIAEIFVETLSDKPGVVLTITLRVNDSIQGISMKEITKQTYQTSVLLTGLVAFLNIYDNLYHTHQFYKALAYANDISCYQNKKINYKNYGSVIFEKLQSNGMLMIKDEKGKIYEEHILNIEEDKIC